MKRIITILLVALIPMMAMSQGNITRPGKKPQKVTTHQNNSGGKKKSNNTGKSNRNNAKRTGAKPTPPKEVKEPVKPAPQPTPNPQPKPLTGTINGHDWVDLGLSVKWATCNVGASSPSDYGDYYAWGETSTKSEYRESNSVTFKKDFGDISGNPQYDAARSRWGGTWRLPTQKEMEELVEKCRWEWTTQNGHTGYLVTSKTNGKSIFVPAAGGCNGASSSYVGKIGICWCSAPYESDAERAACLCFDSSSHNVYWFSRYCGHSIRPVSD